jgi:nitroreductase
VLDLLLDLGDRVPSGGGAELVHFGRVSRAAAAAQLGRTAFAAIERKLTTAYAILAADGAVITVGHRTRRLPRR